MFQKLLYPTGNTKNQLKRFGMINAGIFLVALGIHVFKTPNRFALGGVSGLSLLLVYFWPHVTVGSLMMFLNIVLLAAGYLFLGQGFGHKSVYGSFALSGMVWVMELICPIPAPLTSEKLMELMYGVFLPGMGSAIVFHYGATTGGTDIVAKILTKYFRVKVSYSLLLTDFLIALGAGALFGIEACLLSIMGVCIKTFVLDLFMENLRVFKIVVIISSKSAEIKEFICNTLQRGATAHTAEGAFSHTKREVITTVLSRRQAQKLQLFIQSVDPTAFITISNSSDIIGKGFGRFE